MDSIPSEEQLAGAHEFPGVYQFKAIGSVEGEFRRRVVEMVTEAVGSEESIEISVRETPGGRHVALTMNVNVESPEQVRAIYARILKVEGLILLL